MSQYNNNNDNRRISQGHRHWISHFISFMPVSRVNLQTYKVLNSLRTSTTPLSYFFFFHFCIIYDAFTMRNKHVNNINATHVL